MRLPPAAQLATDRPTIQALVNNVEEVRRFVSRHLNVELQKWQAKHPRPKDERDLPKWEQKISDLEIDWGTIPGVGKPFLKQPGAEKFFLWLQLRPKFINRETEIGNGHLEIVSKVIVYSKKSGEEVFEGPECSCSTMETNYRFRFAVTDKKPEKAEADRLKSLGLGKWRRQRNWKTKTEDWVWLERVENPNIHDERNKVRQIGEKRALVKCARNVGGMSEIFTSDPNEWEDVRADDDANPYDEMDFTAGGRRIVEEDGTAPSGRPVTHEAKKAAGRKAAQAVAEGIKTAAAQGAAEGVRPAEGDGFNGVVEVDQTNENDPIVRGDIAKLLDIMKKNFRMTWNDQDSSWHIDPRDVENVFEMCRQCSYHYWYFLRENGNIIEFADGKRVKPDAKVSPHREAPESSPQGQPAQPPTTTAPTSSPLRPGESVVVGKVKDVYDKMTTGQREEKDKTGKVIKPARASVPYLNILFTDKDNKANFINTFDHDVFPWIHKAKASGAPCTFIVKASGQHTNIVGLVSIGTQEFVDRKVPVIRQEDREAGGKTLFGE